MKSGGISFFLVLEVAGIEKVGFGRNPLVYVDGIRICDFCQLPCECDGCLRSARALLQSRDKTPAVTVWRGKLWGDRTHDWK